MEISLQAQVECTDGDCGSSDYLLIDPVYKQVRHLVVRETSSPNTEYIVPVDLVSAPVAGTIQLRLSKAELEKMDPFIKTESVEEKEPAIVGYGEHDFGPSPYRPYVNPDMDASIKTESVQEKKPAIVGYGGYGFERIAYRPYVNPDVDASIKTESVEEKKPAIVGYGGYGFERIAYRPYVNPEKVVRSSVEHQQIPSGELAVRRGTRVEATDGYVGHVDEFVVNADDSRITSVLMREGHLWGQKDVIIPISAIGDIRQDTVFLKLDKRQIESLPTSPV